MSVDTLSRKEQIQEIAKVLFREKGYAATSMRDLARASGIEPASLYSHFSAKEELLKSICFTIADDFFKSFDASDSPEMDALARLKSAILAHTKVIIDNQDAAAVFFNEWKHLSEPFLMEFKLLRAQYEQRLTSIIKKGMETGQFIKTDINLTSKLILTTINGVHDWYRKDGRMTPREIAEVISAFVIRSLLKT